MSGTIATYQGLPCQDVSYRCSRGWAADTTTVTFLAADFPTDFEFITPEPGDLGRWRSEVRTDLAPIRGNGARTPRKVSLPNRLEFAGALVMAEVDRSGAEFVRIVDPLYCVSVETVRRNSDGSVAVVMARLVDARFFAAQGFIRRWSFNRVDASGIYAKDSVKENGEPLTLAEIADEVAGHLFGNPVLAHTPEVWATRHPSVELARFQPASQALARLGQEYGAGELCQLQGDTVGLYAPGEGRVGYASTSKEQNDRDLPEPLLLDLKGTGQTRGREATYPPDFVVVVGGLRVATVRMDDLEPVLVVEDEVVVLDEETVRKLTKGQYGLQWLNVFVLAPQAYQDDVGLDPRVTKLLREQAYRLWRLPGVEVEDAAAKPSASSLFGPAGFFDAEHERSGSKRRVKGPNAHLLPLLDRAETSAGRRLPVRIDAYRFTSVHRAMAPSLEQQQLAAVKTALERLREGARREAAQRGKPDPYDLAQWKEQDLYVTVPLLHSFVGQMGLRGFSYEEFERAVQRLRLAERMQASAPSYVNEYRKTMDELYEVEGKLGNAGPRLLEVVKKVVEFEKEVAKSVSWDEWLDDEARQKAERLRNEVKADLLALDRWVEEQRQRTQVGAKPRLKAQTAVFVQNLARQLDADAQVYSVALGIVRTSDLSGHVFHEGAPVVEATFFVPKSPLVTFGAVLRPRVDGHPNRVPTGSVFSKAHETAIPSVLSDTESYYTAAYRRTSDGKAEPIALDQVPRGQGVPIERPELVELVPFEGPSNKVALDRAAQTLAEGIFTKPSKVESAKYSVARPWPVLCDGVVSAVEIKMRPNGKGFVTTIHTGSDAPDLAPGGGMTRVRVRRGGHSDAAAREGLLP